MKHTEHVFKEILINGATFPPGENGRTLDGLAGGWVETCDFRAAGACPEPLEVLLLHEDLQTGLRAKHILDHLESRLEPKPRFLVELWRFDMLQEPELQEQAVRDALRANIVIISLHGDHELPAMVGTWLEGWIHSRSAGSCALVVSLDANLQDSAGAGWTMEYLRRTVSQAGLEIFPHFGQAPGSPRDWTQHHTNQPEAMAPLPEWAGRHRTGSHSFGGINE